MVFFFPLFLFFLSDYSAFPAYAAVGEVSATLLVPRGRNRTPVTHRGTKRHCKAAIKTVWASHIHPWCWTHTLLCPTHQEFPKSTTTSPPPRCIPGVLAVISAPPPYLSAEAGGVEDGDLVGTAGPDGLIQRQEGSHGASAHGQAGGTPSQVPQPP